MVLLEAIWSGSTMFSTTVINVLANWMWALKWSISCKYIMLISILGHFMFFVCPFISCIILSSPDINRRLSRWVCISIHPYIHRHHLTVLFQSFLNFAGVWFMVWRCSCGLEIIIKLIFVIFQHPNFISINTVCVLWSQLLLHFILIFSELCRCLVHGLKMCSSDIMLFLIVCQLNQTCELWHFSTSQFYSYSKTSKIRNSDFF